MSRLSPKNLITPQSLLIEKTALELAACYYNVGRSSGLISKHKTDRAFAKANVTTFIPLAVSYLMDILAKESTSLEQRNLIYAAFMERTNDKDLSDIGIPVFENNTPYLADKPVIYDKRTIEEALRATNLYEGKDKLNG